MKKDYKKMCEALLNSGFLVSGQELPFQGFLGEIEVSGTLKQQSKNEINTTYQAFKDRLDGL